MKLILLPAIAGMVVAHPALGQARAEPSTLKTVQSATRSATIEPATTGFVNGALVYPYRGGTIFQVYAAPGLVTEDRKSGVAGKRVAVRVALGGCRIIRKQKNKHGNVKD